MAFKEYTQNLSFADLELRRVLGQSRTQTFLEALEKTIDWKPVETIVLESYRLLGAIAFNMKKVVLNGRTVRVA